MLNFRLTDHIFGDCNFATCLGIHFIFLLFCESSNNEACETLKNYSLHLAVIDIADIIDS